MTNLVDVNQILFKDKLYVSASNVYGVFFQYFITFNTLKDTNYLNFLSGDNLKLQSQLKALTCHYSIPFLKDFSINWGTMKLINVCVTINAGIPWKKI